MQKPELLAPAGSLEKAKTAFRYGADAEGNLALMTPEKEMPAGAEIC